jgi:hypothetical protein
MYTTDETRCTCQRRRRETWRPAYGVDGLEVSSCGRVRQAGTWRIIRGHVLGGYRVVSHHRQRLRVRTLVAETFICPRPPGCVVRAITTVTNRTDAHAWNLAWGLPGRLDRGWARRERERRRIARARGAPLPLLHTVERAIAWQG